MKLLWNNCKAAFAMFSKIPMPKTDWKEENLQYMLCFFPLIGAVIGGFMLLIQGIGMKLKFSSSFVSAILSMVPVFVTGGIHIDGLMDTADALASWQGKEKRLEILKDSHTGAFAVITACMYFLITFGAYEQILRDSSAVRILALGFVLSRSFSALGVVIFPKAKTDGTVSEFSRSAGKLRVKTVLLIYLTLTGIGMLLIQPLYGGLTILTMLAVFAGYHHTAVKYFGGTTGDLSGWFLCLGEIGMAAALAFVSGICSYVW